MWHFFLKQVNTKGRGHKVSKEMLSHSKECFCSFAEGNKRQREIEPELVVGWSEGGRGGVLPSNQLAVYQLRKDAKGEENRKHTSIGWRCAQRLERHRDRNEAGWTQSTFMPGLIKEQRCSDRLSSAPPVDRSECCMQLPLSSVTLHCLWSSAAEH